MRKGEGAKKKKKREREKAGDFSRDQIMAGGCLGAVLRNLDFSLKAPGQGGEEKGIILGSVVIS